MTRRDVKPPRPPRAGDGGARRTTRRDVLRGSIAAGAALATGVGCGASDDEGKTAGGPAPIERIPLGQVTLVRAETPEAAVARALELTGALSFIEPGQRVVVKPNFTGPVAPPDTTHPEVLAEIVRQCLAKGASEVIVAERAFAGSNTEYLLGWPLYQSATKSLRDYVEEAGGRALALDDEPWVEFELPGDVDFDRPIRIPRLLAEADHFINAPALKTHEIAVFTMTLKNLFGYVHPDDRQQLVHQHPLSAGDPDRVKRMFAQMNLAFSPTLNVLDALVSRTTKGPVGGDQADTNLILAGRDRVAMDAVGLAILKVVGSEPWIMDKPVWQQVQLAEAVRRGIGVRGPDEVTLAGEGVAELAEIESALRAV